MDPGFLRDFGREAGLRQTFGGTLLQNLSGWLRWQQSPAHGLCSQADLDLASDLAIDQPRDAGRLLSFLSLSFPGCTPEIILKCLPFRTVVRIVLGTKRLQIKWY